MMIELDAGIETQYLYDDYRATLFCPSICALSALSYEGTADHRLPCESSIESICPTRYVQRAPGPWISYPAG